MYRRLRKNELCLLVMWDVWRLHAPSEDGEANLYRLSY
jgi:hypothetical protein